MSDPNQAMLDTLQEFVNDLLEQAGPDINTTLWLKLDEAEGATKTVPVRRFVRCAECEGRGAPPGAISTPCPEYSGEGACPSLTPGTPAPLCRMCKGRGEIFDPECESCDGTGGATKAAEVKVSIPPGVGEGQVLRLRGMGRKPAGQDTGDLYITLLFAPHPEMLRDGDHLVARVTIARRLAREGGVASACLPGGRINVRVPAGTHSGAEARVLGQGFLKPGAAPAPRPEGDRAPYRSINSDRGDLIARFVIEGETDPIDDFLVLGIPMGSSPEKITVAFRRRVFETHPDRFPNDAQAKRKYHALEKAYSAIHSRQPAPAKVATGGASTHTFVGLGLAAIAALYFLFR